MHPDPVYILSGPVRSGKTTMLQQWLSQGVRAGGILCPDRGERRSLCLLGTPHCLELEPEDSRGKKTVPVGRFVFDAAVFETAREHLLLDAARDPDWLLADEVGKLELHRGEGLEPALTKVIRRYASGRQKGRLLLVIRDSLLEEAITRYGLQNSRIITSTDQLPKAG